MDAKKSGRKAPAKGRKPQPPTPMAEPSPRGAAEASLAAAKAEIASAMAELDQLKREAESARLVQTTAEEPAAAEPPPVPLPEPAAPVTEAPTPPPAPEPPPAFLPVTPTEEASPEAPPAQDASVGVTTDSATANTRGMVWLSNVGWGVAGVGLLLIAYSYWWTVGHYPDRFEPQGIPGAYAGAAVAIIGLILAIVFLFVPTRPSKPSAPALADWPKLAARAQRARRRDVIFARVGIGLMLAGLLATALVYLSNAGVGPNVAGPGGYSYRTLAAVSVAVAALGLGAWFSFGVHGRVQRRLAGLYGMSAGVPATPAPHPATPEPSTPMAPTPNAVPAPRPLQAASKLGVTDDEVKALMKRVDTMLATLPDDVVASFSKTSEADTYLKILGSEPKK